MKLVIQRVSQAKVTVSSKTIGQISKGLLVFVSFDTTDDTQKITKVIHKLLHLRIFSDDNSKFNFSIQDVQGEILLVSQFTLHARLKGHRPSFVDAAKPSKAQKLYHYMVKELKHTHIPIQTGQFGSHMEVELKNDGPVTIQLEL